MVINRQWLVLGGKGKSFPIGFDYDSARKVKNKRIMDKVAETVK
jgi:hypothetical protein